MGETFDFGKPGLGVSSRSASTVASQRWESALILTGCRRPGKYVVLVHGKEVPLSGALFRRSSTSSWPSLRVNPVIPTSPRVRAIQNRRGFAW